MGSGNSLKACGGDARVVSGKDDNVVLNINVLQGRRLPQMDLLSKNDAYAKLWLTNKDNQKVSEVYRTNVVSSNNPVWNQMIKIACNSGVVGGVMIEIYDKDKTSKDDFIGRVAKAVDFKAMDGKPCTMPIVDKKGAKTNGTIKFVLSHESLEEVDPVPWTHLYRCEIEQAEMEDADTPYALLELGVDVFRTKAVKPSKSGKMYQAVWKQAGAMLVDMDKNKHWRPRVTVMEDDEGDMAGVAFLPEIGEIKEGDDDDKIETPFYTVKKVLDTRIDDLEQDLAKKDPNGKITVNARLIPRAQAIHEFAMELSQSADSDSDGFINDKECELLLSTVDVPLEPKDIIGDSGKISIKDFAAGLEKAAAHSQEWLLKMLRAYWSLTEERRKNLRTKSLGERMLSLYEENKHEDRSVITVQDRVTGLLVQESIPWYVSTALKLMYNTKLGRALSSTGLTQYQLENMSVNKGKKYDKPESVDEIEEFVTTYSIPRNDWSLPLDKFKTFNDFFARAVKPELRPIAGAGDGKVLASPADCRMMVFPRLYQSTELWIKGKNFTLANLLGFPAPAKMTEAQKKVFDYFDGGALMISRLSPQDYHRFHWPCDGTMKSARTIGDALYTVNPIAINMPVDVYTDNKRCVMHCTDTPFGDMIHIAVGATMVGSWYIFSVDDKGNEVNLGVTPNKEFSFKKGDISGEFRFGGSTTLTLFGKNVVEFSPDILENSGKGLETLVLARTEVGKLVEK